MCEMSTLCREVNNCVLLCIQYSGKLDLMKMSKKQVAKAVDAPKKPKVGGGWTRVSKCTNRNRGQFLKSTGENEHLLVEKDKHSSHPGIAEALFPPPLDKGKFVAETTKRLPIHQYNPSGKIKLQLFPLDEDIRMGLEKDGYHPYLELTVSTRKKISSVLKHLSTKWGGSSIAFGEPNLLPYNISEDPAGCRWTLSDINVCVGDVHRAIGSPSVFRLRYGWFSNCKTRSSEIPPISTSFEADVQPAGVQKTINAILHGKEKHSDSVTVKLELGSVSGTTDVAVANKTSNAEVEPKGTTMRMDCGMGHLSVQWDDSLMNISIGALLSEASLQGRNSNYDAKANGSNSVLQPSHSILDSFDAFIASKTSGFQGSMPPPISRSSILDGEDTCHPFFFQNFPSSGKGTPGPGKGLVPEGAPQHCSQDAGSKSLEFPCIAEDKAQSGLPEGHNHQESEVDLSLCSQVYKDERSLGLSGIKWTESLGPFDLGLSSSRKIIASDSLSVSKIFA